ncbi:MAG TPA: 4-hydroxythreonine-4-phosphate dehydrogenase PdxA [Aestuariivirga sp.]|nr:4-hydroxythreonine-4-phosphate dehydrogenase PdxA [Aestuariivirga sp.]
MTAATAIALTAGEPAGIGPEITAKAWNALRAEAGACFFLIGDADYLPARATAAGIAISVARISAPREASGIFGGALPVLHRPLKHHPAPGRIDHGNAAAVIAAIDEAAELAMAGEAAAIVTNPIQKESLYAAGFAHQGHTDYLAHLARARGHDATDVMMLVAGNLRTVPVTVHIALAEVPGALTKGAIVAQAEIVARDLKRYFGIAAPRLACTGLNPHAGEGGAMGREEQEIIAPALRELEARGLAVAGPISADTAFHEEARARYDAILCMYHDQALIPVKTLDFHGGVNVTLGLPFIRTSPDHGTALAIAGSGTANPQSLIAAIRLAAQMARHGGR